MLTKCLICNEECYNRQKLAYHINTEHNINMTEYKHKFKPDKDTTLLECPLCGQYNIKQLTHHLTWKHDITKEQFIEQFPDTKLWIDEISNRCSEAAKIGYKTYKNNIANDPHYYDAVYKNRSKNRDWSTFADKVRATRKLRDSDIKLSERTKQMWQDESYRKFQSDKTKKLHEQGLTQIIVKNSGKKRYPITLNNRTYKMRSTWETQLAEYLYNNHIEFKYEPFGIPYMYEQKTRIYYPDFYIIKSNLILEVKPSELCKDDIVMTKKLACEQQGYKFMFITEIELNNLDNIKFE